MSRFRYNLLSGNTGLLQIEAMTKTRRQMAEQKAQIMNSSHKPPSNRQIFRMTASPTSTRVRDSTPLNEANNALSENKCLLIRCLKRLSSYSLIPHLAEDMLNYLKSMKILSSRTTHQKYHSKHTREELYSIDPLLLFSRNVVLVPFPHTSGFC